MKKHIFLILLFLVAQCVVFGHGVAIVDANAPLYFKLKSSTQVVTVYDQVSTTVTTQIFKNQTGTPRVIKYAFPLHEQASATSLRWRVHNTWQTAIFAPAPQDTTLPGGGTPSQSLMTYLGGSPMFFSVPDTIAVDSTLTIELTYVELLPYSFGQVQYDYPNNYQLIQTTALDLQSIHFVLESQRNIDSISFVGISGATVTNNGSHAEITYQASELPAVNNYKIIYSLAANTMGLYGYSTYLPDSLVVCDSLGNGYFVFIVEPQPDTTQVIQKVFSLVIDQSGSMSGEKIEQAKAAATFIVNNLNYGDYFNLIAFNDSFIKFRPDHVPFNEANKQDALTFINNLFADGSTDIAQALHATIQDYAGNDTTVANIVIFLTDGQPTAGLMGTSEILQSIQNDLTTYEVQYLMINTFGIGMDVNQQLLSLIASQNNGLCTFLLDNELEAMITQFYRMICNPVLLNINMTFNPPVVIEPYPAPLPNLYIGQQLIVAGRYDNVPEIPLNITFSGQAFGQIKTYSYNFTLSASLDPDYMFTTKIWAIKKIDHLYSEYFTYPEGSAQADSIKSLIINISVCYNVSSPFTHFGVPTISIEEPTAKNSHEAEIVSAYPNPFRDQVKIKFDIGVRELGIAKVEIYDITGSIVEILYIDCSSPGSHEIIWDGKNSRGESVAAGFYSYRIILPGKILSGKLCKVE